MKKFKLISCIVLSIIIIPILMISDRPSAVIMVENDVPVMQIENEGFRETFNAWYNEKDGSYYFFLPAYMEDLKDIELEGETGKYSPEEEITFAGNHIKIERSSNLPAMFVNTQTGTNDMLHEDKEIKEAGIVRIINGDGEVLFNDDIEYITGRGNSTWGFDKKPYTLKLNADVSLCGMAPGNKWVLLANTYEGTKISYKMMLDLAQYMGMEYTPEAEWVDLYLNGEYRGNYLLCKAIYIGNGSVDISDEGVLVEKDFPGYYNNEEYGFVLNNGLTFSIKDPNYITEEKIVEVLDYFKQIDTLLRAGDKAYLNYLDVNSMINQFLMNELAYNSDTGITSAFFYKEAGNSPLMSGPIWDYDGSFGESNNEWLNYEGTVLDIADSSRQNMYLDWINILYENDPEYFASLVSRYTEIKPYLRYLLEDGIDEYAAYIEDSVRLDMIRWDYGKDNAGHYSSFENNVRFLKFFLSKRISFLNSRWGLEPEEEIALGNGETHTVRFELDGEVFEERVEDGCFLESFPEIEGVTWRYSWDGRRYSEYLPVFEDVTLVGKY